MHCLDMGLFEGLFPATETNENALFSASSKYRRPVHLSTGIGSKKRTEASAADEEPESTALKVRWLHTCLTDRCDPRTEILRSETPLPLLQPFFG